jgi:hypothetical protein
MEDGKGKMEKVNFGMGEAQNFASLFIYRFV